MGNKPTFWILLQILHVFCLAFPYWIEAVFIVFSLLFGFKFTCFFFKLELLIPNSMLKLAYSFSLHQDITEGVATIIRRSFCSSSFSKPIPFES